MSDTLKLIQERYSSRVPFDRERLVAKEDLRQILEAARWTPSAHNMQEPQRSERAGRKPLAPLAL